jgi:CheY-like chemotaxis protein
MVEDRETQAALLRAEMDGCDVDSVSSLEEVTSKVHQQPFVYDAAIIDASIYKHAEQNRPADERPHTDWGIEAARSLRTVLNPEQLLVLSAYLDDVRGPMIALELADSLISKPIHPREFRKRIARMREND